MGLQMSELRERLEVVEVEARLMMEEKEKYRGKALKFKEIALALKAKRSSI